MLTIQRFQITSKNQDQISLIISTRTMRTLTPQHHYHRLPQLSNLHSRWQDHLGSASLLDIAGKRKPQSMNLKNISSSLPKILNHATQFAGGLADALNSQICFAWRATSYVFLVSISLIQVIAELSNVCSGSAVAVERIFSGGCDTISLRRASLTPDTIRSLMLIKKQLHLSCVQADAALHH